MKVLKRMPKLLVYFFLFVWELLKANFQVVRLVLSPRFNFKSAAIRYKTNVKTVSEMILLSNSITLTPGTLVMDANLKKGELLIHVMSADTTDSIKNELKRTLENRVIWALRD